MRYRANILCWLLGLLLCQTSAAKTPPAAFLQAEISPADGGTYVQQQLLYTSRLFYRIPLMAGKFSPPVATDAVVESIGKTLQYQITLAGLRYKVAEQRYTIFPERSGKLELAAAEFRAFTAITGQTSRHSRENVVIQQLLRQGNINNHMIAGDPGTRIILQSDTLELDIKAQPKAYTGADWLPTQALSVQDSWADSMPVLRVGEPVTRIITLEAKGLEASQLPLIQIAETDVLRIYPQRPELSNRSDANWIYGRSIQRFTYVVIASGTHKLPAIQIDWWDSLKHRQQQLVLATLDLEVRTATGEIQTTDTPDEPASNRTTGNGILWLAGAGFLILLISTLCQSLFKCHLPAVISRRLPTAHQPTHRSAKIHHSLHRACQKNDAPAAARALLAWAASSWPHNQPYSLGALVHRLDRGQQAIMKLEDSLYSASGHNWNGTALWAAFNQGLLRSEQVNPTHSSSKVPPLYPDWQQIKPW